MQAFPAIDCHNHIIDPGRFPFAAQGGYRPRADEIGTREAFAAELDRQDMRHALLVQPSCYGTDNRAALDAVAWQPQRFKAIGVVDPHISEAELDLLRRRGLVGVRFNLQFDPGALAAAAASCLLARLKEQGCFVQVHGPDADWAGAASVLRRARVKTLIDHMGLENAQGGLRQAGFEAVLALGRDTDAVVKLSAPFRSSRRASPFEDIDPFVAALLESFGVSRCIWGSDWPFLGVERPPDYAATLAPLARWLPDEADRRAVLWDNPRRLFGFDSGSQP